MSLCWAQVSTPHVGLKPSRAALTALSPLLVADRWDQASPSAFSLGMIIQSARLCSLRSTDRSFVAVS